MNGRIYRAIALLVVVASYWATYQHGRTTMDAEWQDRWSARDAGDKQAWAIAEQQARHEEQRRAVVLEEVRANARLQEQVATVGAVGADAASQRLRVTTVRYASSASNCAADSAAAARGHSATRAAMVLSDLLARADARAGELAQAYDRATIAGFACQRSYELLHE
ncbi:hypothetical protein MF6396_26230 [Pseudomonas sp. MF6396]|uniref:DUF2514 domain-containing protein n=1 Tax=Pseudomonas TaxID=286 RepID=UPI000997D014|nr:DUF2514 domain-containing protein [Pseudomonas palmensis]OOV91959.1 hypothetical protein MF6396_26230 [Pseudomonas sp. MF6396]